MNKKSENMKLLIYIISASVALLLAIAAFSSLAFYINDYFQFKDWTALVVSFAGALIGGIFTMLGVVLSLNRSISDREEMDKKEAEKKAREEKEFLKTQIFIVKSEVGAYLDSIKSFISLMVEAEYQNSIPKENRIVPNLNDWIMGIESIYFLNENIRDMFYDIIRNVKESNKEQYIKDFIFLYTGHNALNYYMNKDKEITEILNKIILVNFRKGIQAEMSELFSRIYKIKNETIIDSKEIEKVKSELNTFQGKIADDTFLDEKIVELIVFLEKLNNEYNA